MNYLFSIIFLVCIYILYYIIGDNLFYTQNYKMGVNIKGTIQNSFLFKIISGWAFFFFVSWIIGLPCQLLSISWDFYFWLYSSCMIILISVNVLFLKKRINRKQIKISKLVIQHLKKYWFIYSLAFIFTALSIFNLQVYRLDNYTDDHYIVKVLNLIGSKHLLDKNYFYGNLLYYRGKFSYVKQQSYTVLNTYELTYSYLSYVFHIYPVVFCRFAMTLHNYLIIFFSLQAFCSLFISEDLSQYSLILLTIFFIPSGYLAKSNLPIKVRMWENWRTQSAIYMGSSIIRLTFFPLTFYFTSTNILTCKRIRILVLIVLFGMFISYQTTALSYIIFTTPIILLVTLLNNCSKIKLSDNRYKRWIKMAVCTLILIVFFFIVAVSDNLFKSLAQLFSTKFSLDKYIYIYNKYLKYYENAFKFDFFAKSFVFGSLIGFLLFIKNKKLRNLILGLTSIYLIFTLKLSRSYIAFIAQEPYCIARMLTSTLMLCVLIIGIDFIKIIDIGFRNIQKYLTSVNVLSCISALSLIFSLIYIKNNYLDILKYHDTGDTVIKDGYSINTISNNDKMIPNLFVSVGNYINKHENSKVAVFSEEKIKYRGKIYSNQNLLLSSSKIQHVNFIGKSNSKVEAKKMKIMNGCNWVLTQYSKGVPYYKYDIIKPFINKAKLKYIFTTRKKIMTELSNNDFKTVINGSDYWLLKRK